MKRWAVGASLALMLVGIVMVCQRFIQLFFRFGFLVIIVGIIAFTVAGHLKDDAPDV